MNKIEIDDAAVALKREKERARMAAYREANLEKVINKLHQASTHWLRHSYGSYLANDKQVPLTYIRDELGHSNISTTSLYLNTDAKQRQKVVSEAFTGV